MHGGKSISWSYNIKMSSLDSESAITHLNNGPHPWPYLMKERNSNFKKSKIYGKQAQITIRQWKKVGWKNTKFDVFAMTDSKPTLRKRKEREEGDPLTHG